MSDSEGSSSDFELVSHDALAASSAAQPSTSVGGQGSSGPAAPANVNMDRSGFVGTLRLLVQDTTRPVSYSGMTTTTTTRRSLHTQLTHSSQQQAQSPPVTDTEYDALSESSMDESDHGHGHDSAQLERAIRLFVPGQPEEEARAPALASQHLSSSSLSSDLHTSRSSLSHSTVSTTSNETDGDDQSPAHIDNQAQDHQEPPVALPLTASVATAAAVINLMDHGDPFPSTFPMLVAHLPTFTLTQVNCGGGDRQDEPAHHHQEEQFTLPGADTDADTDDDCPLIEKITGHHAFNHDLVMHSRLVHHGVASKSPASDSLGRDDDFDELVRVVPHAQAQDAAEPDDAQIDSVIDVTPHRSQLGTLVNTSAAELPDMVPVHHVSDAPAPAAAAGETHSLDASTGAADPNGLMQLLTDLELDGDSTHRLAPAAAGTGERNAAAPAPVPVPRSAMRKSATPPRSPTTSTHHLDLSPPYSRAAAAPPTDPVFASDASLHLISGGTPCPCPSCDLRVDGPGWSLFRTPGPRKYLTASMRKYADAKATHRMHARVRHASVVSTRIAHVITLAVGILIGWLVTTWWVQAGMLEAYQREVRGLHAQLVQGTAQVQATRVAVNQVHTRVAAQGTWVKAEVYEARMQVKQLASVLQAYQRAVLEGGGRGRGVVERFGELMKRADEFLGRVGGMHGYPEGVVKEKKEDGAAAEEQGQEEEAIMVEDVVVAEPDAVPTDTAMPMTPEDPNTQAPPNAPDETVTDTPQPDTNSESPVCSTASDDTEDQDNPHAIVPDSPMSMLKRSLVRAADRIDMKTRRAVLAAARALYQMSACVDEWRARAKLSLEAWLEESRAAKARRAHAAPGSAPVAPVDQEPRANDEVKPEDPTSPTEEAPDSEIPSTSPVGSADANSDDMHATMLREKLRQAQEYLRSVERQEPAEGHVMDKWERIQWANRMSAAKDTVRVVREDLERQLGSSADHV